MNKKLKIIYLFLVLLSLLLIPIFSDALSVLVDSDKDGISDSLEKFAGTDPSKDECEPEGCKNAGTDYLIIILDQSGSMEALLGSDSRMEVAKRVSIKIVQNIPENAMGLGFYSYGFTESCTELKEWQNTFSKLNKKTLIDNIKTIKHFGGTPIANSLKLTRESIQNKKGNYHIVLITDGGEGCASTNIKDTISEAEQLIQIPNKEVKVKLDVIGLDVEPAVKADLERVAKASQGNYIDAKTEEELENAFLTPFQSILANLNTILCLYKQANNLMLCEQKRSDKVSLAELKLKSGPVPDFDYEESQALIKHSSEVRKMSDKRVEEFKKLKNKKVELHIKQIEDFIKKLSPEFKKKKK
jgi:hypothetical protein